MAKCHFCGKPGGYSGEGDYPIYHRTLLCGECRQDGITLAEADAVWFANRGHIKEPYAAKYWREHPEHPMRPA